MLPDPTALVAEIVALHRKTVDDWHRCPPAEDPGLISGSAVELLTLIREQHLCNFLLWHEEDIARSPDASDERIAAVKRAIDRYNQLRNDAIERIDECLVQQLAAGGVVPIVGAKLNSETPAAAVDRLSILALREYHFAEQLQRVDVTDSHLAMVRDRLARCRLQQSDLAKSLSELLDDVFAGRKLLKVYRQMKMYNDPALNPYLYHSRRKAG